MKRRLDVELDFITDLSLLELASKVAPLVQEVVERVRQWSRWRCDLNVTESHKISL